MAKRDWLKRRRRGAGAACLMLFVACGCSEAPKSDAGTENTSAATLAGGGTSSTSGVAGPVTNTTGNTSAGGGGGAPPSTGGTGAVGGTSSVGPTASMSSTSATSNSSMGGSGGTSTDVLADVTVEAGSVDRAHTVTSFEYPEGAGQILALRDAQGSLIPVQVDDAGIATFVLPHLVAGAAASFSLVPGSAAPSGGATASEVPGAVRLAVDDNVVADFRTSSPPPEGVDPSNVRAGYLHPVYAPGGTLVTDDFPIDPEGHPWHHGIWGAWTLTEFNGHEVDFWNSYKGQGRVDLDRVEALWQGPVHAGLAAKLVHTDLFQAGMTAVLEERWLVRVYRTHTAPAPYFVFDLESTQTAATDAALLLRKYDYGGFALRGHAEWKDAANLAFLASDGVDRFDRTTGNGQAGRWCVMQGSVAGVTAALGALGHPSNFRAPQKLRIHPSDPYMAFAPVQDGDFSIDPGEPYVTRLRFVAIAGSADPELLDRLWNDYDSPPVVTISSR